MSVLGRSADLSERLVASLGRISPSYGQGRTIGQTAHRPWPLPDSPWWMAQSWEDLLFAHWPVALDDLRRVMPPQLAPDTFDGRAWIGVTPFMVSAFRLRGLPHVPGVTAFEEINVRTYVTLEGKPGIFFFSLDAASSLAVVGARRTYRLPYFRAQISLRRRGSEVDYRSRRADRSGPPAAFRASYRPSGDASPAAPGSLEHWLTERYCLYTLDERQRVNRGDIHHPPWPLQPAEASIAENTMAQPYGIALGAGEPLLHLARRQDVVFWPIEALE